MNIKYKLPKYNRILLKISGESIKGTKKYGISSKFLFKISKDIKKIIKLGVQIGIVIGGGNLFRGSLLSKKGINHIISDQIGMLSTIINSLAMFDILNKQKIKTCLMSSLPIHNICRSYDRQKALKLLKKKYVVIFSGGTGNPLFTTDSAACLKGIEINADIILKATKVEGVYSSDPLKCSKAIIYKKLLYKEILSKKLEIMDLSAFILAKNHNIPIRIFNINKKSILYNILLGKQEGTLITN
ncbi:UMP kinase [Buchnera aphidicola (Taiwanaphis decaspermi)]|uniref:UMP kinase n=1 Tax=Buchnera aphidicola TaxID=9 RepID=UPI0031B88E97